MSERKWCGHMFEGWIDNCKDCRIAELEAENERLKKAINQSCDDMQYENLHGCKYQMKMFPKPISRHK